MLQLQLVRNCPVRKVLTVAWREFRHTAMTKAFVFGAIIMPILIIGVFIFALPLLNSKNTTPLLGEVAVIAPHDVHEEFKKQLEHQNTQLEDVLEQLSIPMLDNAITLAQQQTKNQTRVDIIEAEIADIDELKRQVREGELAGLIVVPDAIIQHEKKDEQPDANTQSDKTKVQLEVFISSSFSPNHTKILTNAIRNSVVDVRLRRLGHTPSDIHDLMSRPQANTIRLSADGGETEDNEIARKIIPMAFMMLLWIATFTSGNYLLTTTIEEKANKVMEVLLSAISPMQLLGGKILGQAGVSAVILGMYGSTIFAVLIAFSLGDLIPVIHLVLLGVFFVMAYLMVATMMVAVGSAVSELTDAQALLGPVMMILFIPLMLWFPIAENPNGMLAMVTSFTPPLIPFVMILRVTSSTEPVMLWQILLSIVIGFASVVGMIWMSARIFRIGLLMQGKPPNFIQLLRWIKQG